MLHDSQQPWRSTERQRQARRGGESLSGWVGDFRKANAEESISPGALTLSIHNNLCGVLMKLGRYEEAEKGFRTAIAIGAKLAADHSNVPEYQHKLAVGHGNLGLALLWTERLPEAEAACRQAAGMFEKLANDFPGSPEHRSLLGSTIGRLGRVLLESGQLDEAEKQTQRSVGIAERLVADFPDVKNHHALRQCTRRLGNGAISPH